MCFETKRTNIQDRLGKKRWFSNAIIARKRATAIKHRIFYRELTGYRTHTLRDVLQHTILVEGARSALPASLILYMGAYLSVVLYVAEKQTWRLVLFFEIGHLAINMRCGSRKFCGFETVRVTAQLKIASNR